MSGKRILQVLVLAGTFVGWDLYMKEWFMSLVSGGAEPGFAEIFLVYMTPFVLAFILSELLIRTLRIDQPERTEEYG